MAGRSRQFASVDEICGCTRILPLVHQKDSKGTCLSHGIWNANGVLGQKREFEMGVLLAMQDCRLCRVGCNNVEVSGEGGGCGDQAGCCEVKPR